MREKPLARRLWGKAERLGVGVARVAWRVVVWFESRFPGRLAWPDRGPRQRSLERSTLALGWPRTTDSLCPVCMQEVAKDLGPAQRVEACRIAAEIVERDGTVWMTKECPRHGRFDEILSENARFLARLEELFPGRDALVEVPAARDQGSSAPRYGRGAVLNVDLTSRCNLRCKTCFADADHGAFVHELEWEDIQTILLGSLEPRPRRQMTVQFTGGEPTLSPHFLEAVRFARKLGYFCVQCASNGIRFAQDPAFCHAAKQAGLRLCYLQFDGVDNQAYRQRNVSNFFEVKQRAIRNLQAAGIDVVLVATIARGVNDDQVGPIVRFAIDHAEAVTVVSFQPVSFSGRDQQVSDHERRARRYTLTRLAYDLEQQLGFTRPLQDWFPLSALNPLSDAVDLLLGPQAEFGALKCGCHPHCGVGTAMLVHKRTHQVVPITDILDLEGLLRDFRVIAQAGRGRGPTLVRMICAALRNFRCERAPVGFGPYAFVRQLLSQLGAKGRRIGETEGDASRFEWRLLFVAGMWFQDLYNYDFRRTEMCIIPYGTPGGEIAFCAYNTGAGWRDDVQKTYRSVTRADWNREQGAYPVYGGGQAIPLFTREGQVGSRRLPVILDDGVPRRTVKGEPPSEVGKLAPAPARQSAFE
jgi:uncharacterized radical SAM superfamily Fe-S cluster-containing enzyme